MQAAQGLAPESCLDQHGTHTLAQRMMAALTGIALPGHARPNTIYNDDD